jgi:hypothetical protein
MTNITAEEKNILDYLAKGSEYQALIFKELTDSTYFLLIKNHGYFSPNNNPVPFESEKNKGFFTIPFWPALTYLEKASRECVNAQKPDIAIALMEVVRDVSRPKGDRKNRVDNYHTWQYFVKIMANLPLDIIKLEDIELISDWLESKFDASMVVWEISKTLLPKLLQAEGEDLKKVSHLIKIILDSVKVDQRHDMIDYNLQELFKFNADLLGQKCGSEVIGILKNKIEAIIKEKDNDYCYMWRPAIEEHEQNVGVNEYRHILIAGMRDVLLANATSTDATELIHSCLKSDKFIIRRIAIYILDKLFDKYKSLADKIAIDEGAQLFLESNYHHEWYLFIRHHFIHLSNAIPSELTTIVANLTRDWRDDVDKAEFDAMIRRRWLYAIKSSGYSIPIELNDKYFKGIDYKPEHPEFLSYHGPVKWGDDAVFSPAELLTKGDIANIVSFLNNYSGKNRFGEPAVTEAGQSLKDAVKIKQEFFESNLEGFLRCDWEYQYYILQAFEELWQDKKQIDWQKILGFIYCIVEDKDNIFWKKEIDEKKPPLYPRKNWIPSVIASIITKGVQNSEWRMPEEYLPEAEKILRILLDKQEPTAIGNEGDALTEAINSPKGQALESMFSYALRKYSIFEKLPDKGKKEKEIFWESIEPVFNEDVKRSKVGNYEFSSLAGAHLPNLYYLNEGWVRKYINDIFPTEEKHWRCAIQGYSYVNTVYAVIYNLLKDNGHLKRALETDFANDQIKRRIIENVAISYLRGQESLETKNSLFKLILDRWQTNEIEEVISLFWMHRDAELNSDQKEHIYNFWHYCFDRIKGQEEKNKAILSDINLLAVFLDQINKDQKDWLMQSVLYVEERYHSAFLLEYLNKIADKNPREAGEVFLAMLTKTVPWYEEGNIKSFVEKAFVAGLKSDIANPICDKYARAGFEFLTEIYKKYNT